MILIKPYNKVLTCKTFHVMPLLYGEGVKMIELKIGFPRHLTNDEYKDIETFLDNHPTLNSYFLQDTQSDAEHSATPVVSKAKRCSGELLPCPFCGHTDIGEQWVDGVVRMPEPEYVIVYCKKCGCQTYNHDNIEDAKEKWNTRA